MIKVICGLCSAACFFLALGFVGTIETTGDLSKGPAAVACLLVMILFGMIGAFEKWED